MASILERNGAFFIMVSTGYDEKGKQIRKTMSWRPEPGMTEKQLSKVLQEQAVLFEKKVLSGQVLDGHTTFSEFTERWIADYAKANLAPKTFERYESMLKRILPAIGHIHLDKLQPHHLVELYADMGKDINRRELSYLPSEEFLKAFEKSKRTRKELSEKSKCHINTVYRVFKNQPVSVETAEALCDVMHITFKKGMHLSSAVKGLSNKTIRHHHRLISSILNQAVFWQVIVSNPAQRVRPPKAERADIKYLDEKQTAHLFELLRDEPVQYAVMIKLLLYSGVRRGELCGLEWKDVDFDNRLITIKRSSQYVKGQGIFTKETKTETSDRKIKLPNEAFKLMTEYRRWQNKERLKMGDRWEDNDRLFTQHDGRPIHPDTVTGWFRDFIARTDLPKVTIHSLRHTNISLLIAAGIPLRTVSYRAGHAQTSTTANIYSHIIRTSDEMAADVLEDILRLKNYSQREQVIS